MADISLGSVFGKLVISQILVILEHQILYQIKATALSVSIKVKYANCLICIFMNINKFYFYGQKKTVKYINVKHILTFGQC